MGKATNGSSKNLPSKATEEIKIKKEPTRKIISSKKKAFLATQVLQRVKVLIRYL